MTVNIYETTSQLKTNAFCYNNVSDTLQIQEEIVKQLNSERETFIPNFQFYYDEMEKIHANLYEGGSYTLTEVSTKVDDYIGTIGIPNSNDVIKREDKYYGIC